MFKYLTKSQAASIVFPFALPLTAGTAWRAAGVMFALISNTQYRDCGGISCLNCFAKPPLLFYIRLTQSRYNRFSA